MARIRSISPDQWTDDDFCALSIYARMLALALRNMADDNGIVPLKPVAIKAGCLPADPVDIAALLDELEAANVFLVYQQGPSKFLLIRNFQTFQHPNKPNYKHPTPEGELPHGYAIRQRVPGKDSPTPRRQVTEEYPSTPEPLRESSRSAPVVVTPVLGIGIGEVLDHPVRVSTQTQSPQPRRTGQSQKTPPGNPSARTTTDRHGPPPAAAASEAPPQGSVAVSAAAYAAPQAALRPHGVHTPKKHPERLTAASLESPAHPSAAPPGAPRFRAASSPVPPGGPPPSGAPVPPCPRGQSSPVPPGGPFAAALATLTAPATPEALAERCAAIDPRGRAMAPWYTHALQRLDALEALPDVLELLDHAEAHTDPARCATKGLTPLHRPGPWLVRQLTTLLTANGIRHWPDLPEYHPNPRKATA